MSPIEKGNITPEPGFKTPQREHFERAGFVTMPMSEILPIHFSLQSQREDISRSQVGKQAEDFLEEYLNKVAYVAAPQVNDDGTIRFTIVAPPLLGHDISALLYAAAPSKVFGTDFDYNDTISDWQALYEPGNEKRLNAHRKIPGFDEFEASKDKILRCLLDRRNPNGTPLFPVVSWRVNSDKSVVFDAEYAARVIRDLELAGIESDQFATTLGVLVTAAFSPEITSRWPKKLGYGSEGGTQDMGPTQALPLVLAEQHALADSFFVSRMESAALAKYGLPDIRPVRIQPQYYVPQRLFTARPDSQLLPYKKYLPLISQPVELIAPFISNASKYGGYELPTYDLNSKIHIQNVPTNIQPYPLLSHGHIEDNNPDPKS